MNDVMSHKYLSKSPAKTPEERIKELEFQLQCAQAAFRVEAKKVCDRDRRIFQLERQSDRLAKRIDELEGRR